MRRLIACLCAVLAGFAGTAALAAAPSARTPAPWNAYVGSIDTLADWAGFQRNAGKPLRQANRQGQWSAITPTLVELLGSRDLIVPFGGISSGKQAFRAGIGEDATGMLKALMKPGMPHQVYWQIGNEINSPFMQRALLDGQAPVAEMPPPGTKRDRGVVRAVRGNLPVDNQAVIPLYAERIFAPAVAAIEAQAGKGLRAPVMLGTIGNASRPSAVEWLDALLNYRFQPDSVLAGSRVADHVSYLSIHYVVTKDTPPWETLFDRLDREWRKPGIVRGIWATEELGGNRAEAGLGAAVALRVTASYLARVTALQLSPDAIRFGLYAARRGPSGTTGDDGMRLLLASLGHSIVENRSNEVVAQADAALTVHAYSPVEDRGRMAVIAFNRGATPLRVQSLQLPDGLAAPVSVLMLAAGQPQPLAVQRDGNTLKFTTPQTLAQDNTLLIRIGTLLPVAAARTAPSQDDQGDHDSGDQP